ncbi:hypothetical protein pb186bvf_006548 [Paramecium bursaria]
MNQEFLEDLYNNLKKLSRNEEYQENSFLSAKVLNLEFVNEAQLLTLKNIKLYNILPLHQILEGSRTLISQNYDEFLLKDKLVNMNPDRILLISTLLCITLYELSKRGLPYDNMDRLYLIDGHIFINRYDIDCYKKCTEQSSFENFKKFVQKLLGQDFKFTDFEEATYYFLQQNEVYFGHSDHPPFLDFIHKCMGLANIRLMSNDTSLSYIYSIDTPQIIKLFTQDKKIIIKSPKMDNPATTEEILKKYALREIEIMEQLQPDEQFVQCFAYIRILDQFFYFLKQYPTDLDGLFRIFDQSTDIKDISNLFIGLAKGLQLLHDKYNTIHRDLKPQNIFLTHCDITRAIPQIADFGVSRHIQNTMNSTQNIQQNLTPLQGSSSYEAPERGSQNYGFPSDIWQLGLTYLQIANQGVYPFDNRVYFTNEFYKTQFTLEAIKKILEPRNIPLELIEIIAQCLSYEQKDRPTASELVKKLEAYFAK